MKPVGFKWLSDATVVVAVLVDKQTFIRQPLSPYTNHQAASCYHSTNCSNTADIFDVQLTVHRDIFL